MGYNTTVFILNDGLSDIERNPEDFVKAIVNGMRDGGTRGVGRHANCVEVMRTEHADVPRLYFSQGNWMNEFSRWADDFERAKRDAFFRNLLLDRCQQAKRMINEYQKSLKELDEQP